MKGGMGRSLSIAVAVLMFLAIGMATDSKAAALFLDDGNIKVTIEDNGAGDINPMLGVITFNQSLGNWIVNVTTGITKPVLGTNEIPRLDLNSVNVTSSGSGPADLLIGFSETGFTYSGPGFTSLIGGVAGGTVDYKTYLDANNILFGMGSGLSAGLFGPGAFAWSDSATVGHGSQYSLTELVQVSHTGPFQATSFNAEIITPEPGTMFLLGSGLICLAGWGRKKFRI
jgi:hypothetical protein